MAVIKYAPKVSAQADDRHENLKIEIELPGVDRKDIILRMVEDSFFVKADKNGVQYFGSYTVCCPVDPKKASAKYSDGMLRVTVPYKQPFENEVEIRIE